MYIAELTYPGTWLDYPDRQWSWEIQNLLRGAEAPLAEAAIALTWFEEERQKTPRGPEQNEWETDATRLRELEAKVTSELGVDLYDVAHGHAIRLRAEVELHRERWNQGVTSDSYQHRFIFMHAKTFLLALDRIDKHFGVLARSPGVPAAVAEAKVAFEAVLPALRGVRNSIAHHEDRSRGLAKDGKPLDLKPIDNEIARAPGGVLVLESLVGSRFCSTMADGHYGEVEVTPPSLEAARQLAQTSIEAFRWKGPPHHWPR